MLIINISGDKERRSIDQNNRDLKSKLLSSIDEVDDNLNSVKNTLDGKLDEVQSKIQQIEASNQSKIQHIEASYKEATIELTKNIEGMGKRLLQRIDDRIDELIARQDKIFEEMHNARNEQDNTVNVQQNVMHIHPVDVSAVAQEAQTAGEWTQCAHQAHNQATFVHQ